MIFTAELLLSFVVAFASAGGVYAAIRADLARLHERSEEHAREINYLRAKVYK
jgi:hypothetical protein